MQIETQKPMTMISAALPEWRDFTYDSYAFLLLSVSLIVDMHTETFINFPMHKLNSQALFLTHAQVPTQVIQEMKLYKSLTLKQLKHTQG